MLIWSNVIVACPTDRSKIPFLYEVKKFEHTYVVKLTFTIFQSKDSL